MENSRERLSSSQNNVAVSWSRAMVPTWKYDENERLWLL